MTTLVRLAFFVTCINSTIIFADTDRLVILEPWIQAAPPTSQTLAGYLSIKNTGTEPISLTGIKSNSFYNIEIHKTIVERNGMVRMFRDNQSKEILAGDTLHFRPGGYHLILIKPNRPIKEGEKIKLIFHFSNADKITAEAEVRRYAEKTAHNR